MRADSLRTLLLAMVLGAGIWALSSWLTGHREPWDAGGSYYVVALALSGVLAGAICPRPVWANYLGSVIGQAAYELIFLPIGPLFPLGIAFLLAYSGIFAVAAFASGWVRLRVFNHHPKG
ncbi:MAG: hypothetical protein JNM76_13710 [Betaproteobacteria bacterium]|nr:hypothetical protein [Betaproteobacteria bacterium]